MYTAAKLVTAYFLKSFKNNTTRLAILRITYIVYSVKTNTVEPNILDYINRYTFILLDSRNLTRSPMYENSIAFARSYLTLFYILCCKEHISTHLIHAWGAY